MSAIPQVPPRPTRSQHQQPLSQEIPRIPPRPNSRKTEGSQSPNRESYPRSPFNEPPLALTKSISSSGAGGGGLTASSRNTSSSNLPQRPPSVSLPSVGQEGMEYADIDYHQASDETSTIDEGSENVPKETRQVAGDLPLHAPKPSFSDSTAKSRVQTVTRTDSTQAAAAGLGKAPTPTVIADDASSPDLTSKSRVSFRSASTVSTERPSSTLQTEDEQGIPEIGQRVPMYPDAGDVQAPSPAPIQSQFPTGIGFHNSGTTKPGRHHRRTPSGREVAPPGSYGMHGHGIQATDQFERDWYAKHPDALLKEENGEYGPGIGGGRGEWAMSSDDLNKLVYETASMKTSALDCQYSTLMSTLEASPHGSGLPTEQIGYQASEEYSVRILSPPSAQLKLVQSNSSQPHIESPLRKSSFPVDPDSGAILQKTRSYNKKGASSENAMESETETEDEGIRLAPPSNRTSKYTGNGYDPPTEDLGPRGGNTEAEGGFIEERGYGVPILASDELAKTPGAEFMQPAISPSQERRSSGYMAGVEGGGEYMSGFKTGSRGGSAANSRPSSRPSSRPGSIYSIQGLSRFSTHDDDRDLYTPLEDVDEYEPLFPDEDGDSHRKPLTAAERVKLREQMKRFPSQDIWEDTPNSLQLEATVETPEAIAAQQPPSNRSAAATFETAEQEAARKGEPSEAEKAKLLPAQERLAKSRFKPHLKEEMDRPSMRQRFPSRDIWEDSPDSTYLETTVGEMVADDVSKSPPDAGLEAGAVVQTYGRPKEEVLLGEQERENATAGGPSVEKPSIPPRPNKYKVPPAPSMEGSAVADAAPPTIPARPSRRQYQVPPADAQVPIDPSKLEQDAKLPSPTEARKAPELPGRPKPQIPPRPGKPAAQEPSETTLLSKVTSASSVGSEDQGEKEAGHSKLKPVIPARPAGSKIANLKAGFLGDLESRLKLGPQGPKPQQKEKDEVEPSAEEKAPLADARKGRAKGPARRRPVPTTAAAVAAAATGTSEVSSRSRWQTRAAWTVWETIEDGRVTVPIKTPSNSTEGTIAKTSEDQSLATEDMPIDPTTPVDEESKVSDSKQATGGDEGSILTSEPVADKSVGSPTVTDLPTPSLEKERNPLSKEPPTPVSSPPSKVVSADPVSKVPAEVTATSAADGHSAASVGGKSNIAAD